MDWMWLVFMIVGVGVWLVVTVFRKAEEERQREMQRQRDANRGAGRRPTTDLDRFLDEARRRRDVLPTAVPLNRPPRRVRETPSQPRPSDRPSEFTPSVRRSASEQRAPLPTALPAPSPKPEPGPVVLELVPDDTPAAATQRPTAVQTPSPPAAVAPAVLGRREVAASPVRQQLLGLLRQPQTMGTAFVLSEILGPPVCRKGMR